MCGEVYKYLELMEILDGLLMKLEEDREALLAALYLFHSHFEISRASARPR